MQIVFSTNKEEISQLPLTLVTYAQLLSPKDNNRTIDNDQQK